ncbi:MAG: polymer-forming cytoskeletal protein [Clostridia bacterium]|nr:polymer-forming cytoskeletal protein [Clostridia bacterium]
MNNNININGSGSVSGGTYDTVTINGSGRVNGDLICHSMTINGSGTVGGNLKATVSFSINGSGRVEGNITESGTVSISGSGKIRGSVHCHAFRSSGSASVDGDCEGEDMELNGGSHIGGLLNGEKVRIYLYNRNYPKIGSIGGTDIQVKHRPGGNNQGWHIRIFGIEIGNHGESEKPGFLETDTIEGDVIDLAYTRASRVSGRVVKIGPGCVIDRVEYTESAEIDSENSTVEKVVQC